MQNVYYGTPLYANILIKNIGQVSAKVTMLATLPWKEGATGMLDLPLTAWYI
jgi:hypothetical protein